MAGIPAERRVYRVALPIDRLQALTTEERSLLFLLGYAANQIAMLGKLVVFSSNKTPDDAVEQKLSGAQTQMLARLAIGILTETWELVHKRFISSPVGRDYTPLLDAAGQKALAALKTHFGGSSLLNRLRNNYAFHFPRDSDVEAAFETAAKEKEWDADWNWYFAPTTFNTFFFASDIVMLHGLLGESGETDLVKAQQKIMDELRTVSDALTDFVLAFAAAVWLKHFGTEMVTEICADTSNAPDVFEIWLPFFVKVKTPAAD
jgi:hypothetical protein